MKSESSLSAAAMTQAMLCSQVTTLQTGLSSARACLTPTRLSAVPATAALNAMRSDHERLESQVSDLSSTVDDMRLQLTTV